MDEDQQINPQLEQAVDFFNQRFKIDPAQFGAEQDAEQWAELFWILNVAYFMKFVSDETVTRSIQEFSDLDSTKKVTRIIEIRNFVDRELNELEHFNSIYGSRLELYKIEKIVENLPDIKSKIKFLFMVETGLFPEENPAAFDQFANNLIVQADPELQIQNRLQTVMNDRNRLNLGSLESRQSRAISAEEVSAYLQRNQQNRPPQN